MNKSKRFLSIFISLLFTLTIAVYTASAANNPEPIDMDEVHSFFAAYSEDYDNAKLTALPRVVTCCERPNVSVVTRFQHLPAPDSPISYCLLIFYWQNKECLNCGALIESTIETWYEPGCGYNCGNY